MIQMEIRSDGMTSRSTTLKMILSGVKNGRKAKAFYDLMKEGIEDEKR